MTNKTERKCNPVVLERNTLFKGKWLKFEEIIYKDFKSAVRSWENVKRTPDRGAAVIIAVLRPSNRLVLIRQYRPPTDKYIIEFPAGLIDGGEDCNISAVRELKEETGYVGKVVGFTAPVYSSPGLTDETVSIVFIDVDEGDSQNINPVPANEATEDIEVFLVDLNKVYDFLNEREKLGDKVDAKLRTFSLSNHILQV